jgi:hypothetical protein
LRDIFNSAEAFLSPARLAVPVLDAICKQPYCFNNWQSSAGADEQQRRHQQGWSPLDLKEAALLPSSGLK